MSYYGSLFRTFHCPVCKDLLGRGHEKQKNEFLCDTCQAYFTFYPNAKKPKAELKKHRCQCGSCQTRRGEFKEEKKAYSPPKSPPYDGLGTGW